MTGLPNEIDPLFVSSTASAYTVSRSLRFRSSVSAYLNRTPASTSNRTTFTVSAWVKVGIFNATSPFLLGLAGTTNGSQRSSIRLEGDTLVCGDESMQTATNFKLQSTAVFRDPSAWYHIVVAVDTTQATSTNRIKMYVNGVQITSFSTANYPSLNYSTAINLNNTQYISRWYDSSAGSVYADWYLAEYNFIDGQQLTPSSFGAYDSNNIWQPKKYTGTYGTNGFYLPFSNTSTTSTLVADSSGNGNNWTPNNISLTAGTTYDSMIDSPTVSASASNYAVLNPLNVATTLSSGNLNSNPSSANWLGAVGTVGFSSGKFYYEATITATTNTVFQIFGIARSTISNATIASNGYPGATADGWGVQFGTPSYKINNGTFTALVSNYSYTTNDVIMIAVDVDAGKFWYGKNGTWIESGNPANGTNALFTNLTGTIIPMLGQNTSGNSCAVNFGQRAFAYTAPSGFNALNTYNLPAATIKNGAPYMNAITYTGYGPLVPSGLGILTKRNASTQNVSKSLRFRLSAGAYLNRTPASAGNQTTWTWSSWVKRGTSGTFTAIFSACITGNPYTQSVLAFDSSDKLWYYQFSNATNYTVNVTSTAVFRDPSAWYHVVMKFDANTSSMIVWVNNQQVINSSSFSTTYRLINTTNVHYIGNYAYQTVPSGVYDGYFAEINFIDGQALTPSSFGETNSDGVWVPKAYTGTYGTNGFYLPFTNTTSTTTLVADSSGNGNNWTPNNISLTAGTTYDSMVDSPTDYASAGNYATMNPLDSLSGTVSAGNLTWTATASQSDIRGTIAIPSSGKFYMECTVGSTTSATVGLSFGLATSAVALNSANAVSGLYQLYASSSGYLSLNGTNVSSSLGTWTAGDILQIAVDADNTKMWLGKNNTWYDSSGGTTGNPSTGANATSTTSMVGLYPFSNCYQNNATWNFGQRAFSYTAPTGFTTLNTYNIATPSTTWFSSANNSGTGSATAYPDLVWIKARSSAQSNSWNDTVRGPTLNLVSNTTAAEVGASTMFNVNKYGLTLGNNASVNSSSYTDVMWGWQGGQGTTSTNTSGTITSTTSVNTTAGFSIVTYTGTGANATVGHGLGVAPSMIIIKNRQAANSWVVYHVSTGNGNVLLLNSTNASTADSTAWNTTTPTSSVFSLGSGAAADTNQTSGGGQHVAYCFASVSGYSAFGSYTGNGSADGPFVYVGFRPRWVMFKNASAAATNWIIFDSTRNTYNVSNLTLDPASSNAELTSNGWDIDILSNGFKIRNTSSSNNGSGNTIIYAAFAENPFTISRAR